MAKTTTTGTRTSKGEVIALANGLTRKGAEITVALPGGQTVTGTVTSGWFRARFGPDAGRQVVFVRPANSRPSRPASRPRTGGRFNGGGRCGNIWFNSAGDHEQNCNNPAC